MITTLPFGTEYDLQVALPAWPEHLLNLAHAHDTPIWPKRDTILYWSPSTGGRPPARIRIANK